MITILAGGTGSAKLVRGFAALTNDITIISNVGDNIWQFGLYVCPDIDTIVYSLAGILDERRSWGIKDDSFNCLDQLRKYGVPTWFSLGDRDMATHILRTQMLRQGHTLTEITESTRKRLGISARIFPSTDDQVTTIISTAKGKMHLQDFWVKNKGTPRVTGVSFDGSETAIPNPNVIKAIRKASAVVVAPGNPVSSIGPIIAIKEIRQELRRKRSNVVAVSPIIGGRAISGPAADYMKAEGLDISSLGVAKYYRAFVGTFVISESDHSMASGIRKLGMTVLETNLVMKNKHAEIRLAGYLLKRLGKS